MPRVVKGMNKERRMARYLFVIIQIPSQLSMG